MTTRATPTADIQRSQRTASPAQASTPPGPAVPATGQALSRWLRKAWIWFVLAALLVLVALPSMLRQNPDTRQLSPSSPAPNGGQAVVRVLQAQGITVHPAESLEEALALAEEHPQAPVLFHDAADHLPETGLDRLSEEVAPERRVLVEPGFQALGALAPAVAQAGQVPDGDPLASGEGCGLPMGREAQTIGASGLAYRSAGAQACFPVPGTESGSTTDPAHAVLETADGTVVIGHVGVFANESADAEGHPVLALWSLGRSSDVVWYLPGLADVAIDPGPPTMDQLLPDWVRPAGIWLILCLAVLMLWRGRRHGPLAVEPLPVIVPASETAVGRARLYERSGQHGSAARALRSATLLRLSRALRLGHGASVEALVTAAARTTGREPRQVAAVLDVSHVATARELVSAGRGLLDLEDAVRAGLTTDHAAAEQASDSDGRTP
ncbi:DUF4350 domain-containing protein [Citricoccus sp.]|uniref:DUF4350 domain-containing protein n=1 Tax=Citricoccus sp. TaxID=1978372 RepID=UPI0028BE2A75|nr:DUF4350 domain-containing protein [Citricoccus sp.]